MDQQLLVFVTVAELGNFTKAAEKLHMTQPAVSQYIQSIERNYGMKLLERSNKFVRLNKPGEIVYYHAKEILSLYEKVENLLDDLSKQPKGPLKIGASYSYGEYVLPNLIARLHEAYPHIRPSITIGNTKEVAEFVIKNQLDIGIIEGWYNNAQLQIETFADDAMYIVTSTNHSLANHGEKIEFTDLENETWIVREEGSGTREATEKLFKQLSISPKNLMVFGSTQLIKESVEAGLGITLLSQWTFRKEEQLDLLKTLPIKGTPFNRKFSLVYKKTAYITKALEVFIELLKNDEGKSNHAKEIQN